MKDDELEAIRAKLGAREEESWARLEDAVSELWAVHEATEEEIIARVRAAVDRDRRGEDSATA